MNEKILIDVREPKEFFDYHLEGSINIPSSNFKLEDFLPYKNHEITLICQSGKRAKNVLDFLTENGFNQIELVEEHIERIDKATLVSKNKLWSVDRQFRFALGILLITFLLGFHFLSRNFIIIPIILATGLTVTAIIDRCYFRMLIAKMPWNKRNQ